MNVSRIPLCRADLGSDELQAVAQVLESGWLTMGPRSLQFEQQFAAYMGVPQAISLSSCTSALFLALAANDIKGEVIIPSFTFVATASAVRMVGATPVFVDITANDRNMDPDALEAAITPRTEAIIVVHFAGQCADMPRIAAIAQKHSLLLIEDCAETIGGTCNNQLAGSWGIGCFSFFPTKNITTGEGGMLTCHDETTANRVRSLASHGIPTNTYQRSQERRSWRRSAQEPGYNLRMSDIHAAIGIVQLQKLNQLNQRRRQHSLQLNQRLAHLQQLSTPVELEQRYHVFQMYTLLEHSGQRDALVFHLRDHGIEASVHFDPPVHRQPAFANIPHAPLPVTESVADNILTLPMFPGLDHDQIERMALAVEQFYLKP